MGEEKKSTGTTGLTPATTRTIPNPYNGLAELKDGVFHFRFSACLDWMEKQGKTLFGNHFAIFPEDHSLIYKLLVYAIGDQENTARQNMDLKKGILLNGPIGVGKTAILTLANFFFPPEKQYLVKPTREISFEFEKDGYSVINRYSKGAFCPGESSPVPVVYCFDDLGIEQPRKYFGNECNVMAEILLSRYDLFVTKHMLTHITTNLSASELEAIYGNRIRSRMREMFNLVAFDRDSKDKRR
ncbi:MAG: ATPase [Mangrovibacterium sp.]|nr:ATPase [Mangrovibacterium sp.]